MEGAMEESRMQGQPRRWKDDVIEWTLISIGDAVHTAQKCVRWRQTMNSATGLNTSNGTMRRIFISSLCVVRYERVG